MCVLVLTIDNIMLCIDVMLWTTLPVYVSPSRQHYVCILSKWYNIHLCILSNKWTTLMCILVPSGQHYVCILVTNTTLPVYFY